MKKRLESTKMMQQVDGMKAVCDSAVYLVSDLSESVTGECINGKGLESEWTIADAGSSHVRV